MIYEIDVGLKLPVRVLKRSVFETHIFLYSLRNLLNYGVLNLRVSMKLDLGMGIICV